MNGRTLWIALMVGILCVNAAAAVQGRHTKPGAGSKPPPQATENPQPTAPAPAAQAGGSEKELKDLTGKVKALEDAVNKLSEPQRLETLQALDRDVKRLADGQSKASWAVAFIIAVILAGAVWMLIVASRIAAPPQAQIAQAVANAIVALPTLQQITGALPTLQQITGAVNAARTEVTEARAAVLERVGATLTAVNEARDAAHQEAMHLRQSVTEVRTSFQAATEQTRGPGGQGK